MTQKITTHIQDARDRLLYQFREKLRLQALLDSQTRQIQDLEDAAFSLIEGRSLQAAVGATLDRWGQTLDVPRLSMNDADYRSTLFFKVERNISNGTPEELIRILATLVPAESIHYVEDWPAGFHFTLKNAEMTADADLVLSQMRQLSPAGVRLNYIAIDNIANPFGFFGSTNEEVRGLDTWPLSGNGGTFATLL